MRIGIDLGGTKIEAVLMDERGQILQTLRVTTPASHYTKTLQAIAELVSQLESECGRPCPVGIGTPGSPARASGLMKNCNSVVLNDKALQADLEALLRRDIRMANDADCFALSEATDGAGAGYNTVFGVILGTGVGGGLVVNRQLIAGPNGLAGEWGHNPLPGADEQRPCYCGGRDCIESHLNGAGLLTMAATSGRSELNKLSSAQQLSVLAEQGNEYAAAILQDYARKLSRALATVINIVDPDIIVLGGGLSNIQRLYRLLPPLLAEDVFGRDCVTPVVAARYGDASGVRGAAWLWPVASAEPR